MKQLFVLSLFFTAGLLLASDDIAMAKSVTGEVKVKRDGAYVAVAQGTNLRVGDLLVTSENSNIGLTFNDGTLISVGQKSMLQLNKYLFEPSSNKYDFDVMLEKGTVVFESGKLGKLAPEKVVFRVPQGSVGIRGTKFLVDVE